MPPPEVQEAIASLEISHWVMPVASLLTMISSPPLSAVGKTHASRVIDVGLSDGESGTSTNALVPFRLKACPTSPAAKAAPPWSEPLFAPSASSALFSARHQLTMLGGTGAHAAHLPELPALAIAAISGCDSARRKTSTSSICPFQKYLSVGQATAMAPILFCPSARVNVPVVMSGREVTSTPSR